MLIHPGERKYYFLALESVYLHTRKLNNTVKGIFHCVLHKNDRTPRLYQTHDSPGSAQQLSLKVANQKYFQEWYKYTLAESATKYGERQPKEPTPSLKTMWRDRRAMGSEGGVMGSHCNFAITSCGLLGLIMLYLTGLL